MSLGETILQLYMFIFALTWFYRLPPDDEHGTGSTKLDHRQVPDIDVVPPAVIDRKPSTMIG